MAIQYYMRAFNTTLSQYVDWIVNDAPDGTGTFSGYPTNQLIDITVNRVVQSKIENFLKPNQGLGGQDGYYFHVNSYDIRNVTPPLSAPTQLVGIAVERGITSIVSITTASNASPIQVTTASPHGLTTGRYVTITGVLGNIAANGTFQITFVDSTNFTLNNSRGSGAYTSGGNVSTPNDFSTLTWDEISQYWRFVLNTNGDSTTLGASQQLRFLNALIDGYIALGSDPADSGALRLSNNTFVTSESNPTGTDIQLIGADNLNRIKIGSVVGDLVYTPGSFDVDGYIVHDGTGTNAALSGFIREQNNTVIIAFRNAAGALDIAALSSNVSNNVILGDNVNSGVIYRTTTGNVHQFQVNNIADFEIGNTFARFTTTVTAPLIFQVDNVAASGVAQTLTLQAQNATGTTSTGGLLLLQSGSGTSFNAPIEFKTGPTTKFRINPTVASTAADNNSIQIFENLIRIDSAQTTPRYRQDDVATASATGQTFTVQAQNATGTTSNGGVLALTSGTGTSTTGQVQVQTGGTTQIIVSPTFIAPGTTSATTGSVIIRGSLEVVGTTTTVDSTVVDIIGRVIHANWADPSVSPSVAVPSQIAGYSVHRGNVNVPPGFARDGAAVIWTEGAQNSGSDGYWRHVTIPADGYGTDNFTIANSTNSVGVMAGSVAATPDPNPVTGTLPGTGGLKTPNNLPSVVARNVSPTTTIAAASNLVTLPQGTINVASTTGFTTSGTLLIFSDAGVQTVTYTGTGGTTFTGATGGTGLLHTGSFVAQTNNATTIAAPSNNTSLPAGTINVVSTVGFPASGTIRVISHLSNIVGAPTSLQTVTYTSTTATTFAGCTGGTGQIFTGDAVTSPPIAGTADLVLLGTDFGNRILHGAPTANTGHIFNTPTNALFDFQVNSVPQIRIQANDTNADGYVEVFEIEPTVVSPRIAQLVRPDTGANAGFQLMLQAQNGQQQSGAPNNNGGNLVLASGAAGTGGTSPAVHGNVILQTDSVLKVTIFPTFAASASDSNTMLIEENIIRIGPTQNIPLIRQDSTTNANGQSFTLQAQNAATRGGPLLLVAGTGTGTQDGYINLVTGATVKMTVFPTTAVSAGDNNSILFFENLFRVDTAQTTPRLRQDDKTANGGTGETFTIQAQNETGTTSTGGALNLTAGSGTSTGGAVNIISGAGPTAGLINLLIGGTQAIAFNNVDSDASGFSEVMTIASTITAPRIFQASTGGASGTILALMAQNAATTGGPLQLHSGTGATNDGYINLTTGSTVKMTVFPTTATVAANNNSILFFENKLRFDTAQVNPLIRQDDVTGASATGQSFTLQAQNATGTTSLGGDGYFTSGTGTTQAGNIHIQTGGVDKIITHPSFTEFRDTAEALRITPVSAGTTQVTFAATVTAVTINQTQTASTPSAPMTIQSQVTTAASGVGGNLSLIAGNATGTTSTGGDGYFTSGTGTTVAGNIHLQTGAVSRVIVHPTFTEFRDTSEAYRITPVSAGATTLQAISTATSVTYKQGDLATASGTGATTTVQAQNEVGATSVGGALNLTSGTGTTTNGAVNLQVGGVTTASLVTDKFVFNKGRRRNVSNVTTTITVPDGYDYIAVDSSSVYTISLPATPTTGDSFEFKDVNGTAGTNTVTISGNGKNIDGAASFPINSAYQSIAVTYTGTQWSIS